MMAIQNFKRIRRDGKVIDESMKAKDMLALGPPEKVIEIQWHDDSRQVSLRDDYGMLAIVIPGREFVVANGHDESGQHRVLSIINADGSQRMQLSNIQAIRGKDEAGEFHWFEPSRIESPNVFGVIFNRASDNSFFQLDIDAINGNVVGVYPVR